MTSLTEAARLKEDPFPVVSVCGAGGKTTTIRRLAKECADAGRGAAVMTTTHMIAEDAPWFLVDPSIGELRETLERYGQVWAGAASSEGKIESLSRQLQQEMLSLRVPVFIEADGARRLPAKVPAGHEPVILLETGYVLYVYGLDAVGRKIAEVCFRPELAGKLLGKKTDEEMTAEDIAFLAASPLAGRKGCPEGAEYTVILNKADDDRRMDLAIEICRKLTREADIRVLVTSSGQQEREAGQDKT